MSAPPPPPSPTPREPAASEGGWEAMAKSLLVQKALWRSAEAGDEAELARALADGAELDALDENGWTPAMLAAFHGRPGCLRALLAAGAKGAQELAPLAAASGCLACLSELAGSKLHSRQAAPRAWDDAAILAAQENRLDCLRLIAREGVDANARGRLGVSAAMAAAEFGSLECLAFLAHEGADLKARCQAGRDALSLAALEGHAHCLRLLLAHGCDPDASAPPRGETPAMLAASRGREEALLVLAGAGADLAALDSAGRSAARIARETRRPGIAELIESLMRARAEAQEIKAELAASPRAAADPARARGAPKRM